MTAYDDLDVILRQLSDCASQPQSVYRYYAYFRQGDYALTSCLSVCLSVNNST